METRTFKKGELEYTVKRVIEEDPDLSYLGTYSDKPAKIHIDRQKRGDMGRNEFRYFNLGYGDKFYLEHNYKRAEAFNRGEWCMVGVVVSIVAWIPNQQGPGCTTRHELGHASLWGIESDSDASYFEEVEKDLIAEAESSIKNLKTYLCHTPK